MEYRSSDKKMVLKKDKRGMFFTILAIALLALFLVSYSIYYASQDRKSISKRIASMNDFIFSLEKDMSRQVYISGYRAILSLNNHITTSGSFLADSKNSIIEALVNGTIDSQNISLMEGYRLVDWNSRVSSLGDKMNLFINYSIKEINISQDNPWSVKIDILMDLIVRDKGNLASWNKVEIISSQVEVEGFEDPIYLINTNGRVVNKINKTIYTFSSDISNLTLHSLNSYYIASSLAPSFLDRLEGKTSSNPNGIESLVYLPELAEQGLAIKDKSCVDYIYFLSDNPVSHNIQGMPSWFKLDDAHLSIYGVSGLI